MYKNLPKFNDGSYVHFVTTRTYENRPFFRDAEFARILLDELRFYSKKYGFIFAGYVIMPDHVHLLLWWDSESKPELSVSKIMQAIKGATARRVIDLVKAKGLERMLQPTHREDAQLERMLQPTHRDVDSKSHKQNLKCCLWQPGFYDFNIYSEDKLLEKLEYIHANPVKAGLVDSPEDYRWSSYREYFEGSIADCKEAG